MKLLRVFCLVVFFTSSGLAQFQAQNGWGLPHRVATTAITQGVVLDGPAGRIIAADQTGLLAKSLTGGADQTILTASGIKGLVGTGGGSSLALAWYQRSLTENSAVWGWFQGKPRKLAETEFPGVAVTLWRDQPLTVYAVGVGDETVIYAQSWAGKAAEVRRTKLNIGALAVNVTPNGQLGIVFAEGYRNPQDEKYDAIFSLGDPETGFQARRLGAAVFTGREQRYAVAVRGEQLLPAWWYESDEQQRVAALTKTHDPHLAYWDGSGIREFTRQSGELLGQTQDSLYYALGSDIWALELNTGRVSRQLIAPDGLSYASLEFNPSTRVRSFVWQSLQADGFASTVYQADSSQPYQPTVMDRVSVALGWNPWFPAQSALAQTLMALLLGAGATMLTAPVIWFTSSQRQIAPPIAALIGVGFVVAFRLASGAFSAPGWSLEPLLTPPWWTAGVGVLLGLIVVVLSRKRLSASELGPTIASSLVVLLGVFVMVFSRAGFVHF